MKFMKNIIGTTVGDYPNQLSSKALWVGELIWGCFFVSFFAEAKKKIEGITGKENGTQLISGRLVYTSFIPVNDGKYTFETELLVGTYFVKVQGKILKLIVL
jgi:hypothetical protein